MDGWMPLSYRCGDPSLMLANSVCHTTVTYTHNLRYSNIDREVGVSVQTSPFSSVDTTARGPVGNHVSLRL
jgi:hypothetical protein